MSPLLLKKNIFLFVNVSLRFELGSLDSESKVLTIRPWDPTLENEDSKRKNNATLLS